MTLDEAVSYYSKEMEQAQQNVKDCYAITSLEVSVLQKAVEKFNIFKNTFNYLSQLDKISKIMDANALSDNEKIDAYNQIMSIINENK